MAGWLAGRLVSMKVEKLDLTMAELKVESMAAQMVENWDSHLVVWMAEEKVALTACV